MTDDSGKTWGPNRRGFLRGLAGGALGLGVLSSGCGLLTNEVGPIEVRDPSWKDTALSSKNRKPLSFRVASYNVHHWWGLDNTQDARRIGEVLQAIEPDVVALQETDMGKTADTGQRRLEVIADMLDMQLVTMPLANDSYCFRGNALLTRFPINKVRNLDFSQPDCDPRGMVDVELAVEGELVRIIGAHLGLDAGERARQITKLLNWLYAHPKRRGAVVMGDFNEWFGGSANYDVLERYLGRCHGRSTFPADTPIFHLDHIWTDPAGGLKKIRVPSTPLTHVASDHRPIWADVDL